MYNENNEFIYSVKVSEDIENECTGVYRNPLFADRLISNYDENPINSIWELFYDAYNKFKDYELFGKREMVNNKLGEYVWKTFKESKELIIAVGSGLLNLNLCRLIECDDPILEKARFLGFYMPNNIEWTICDIACNAYNIVTVPLYDSLGPEACKFILDQTLMETIICNKSCALKLFNTLKAFNDIHLKKLIIIDLIDDELKNLVKQHNLELITWDDILNEGKKNIIEIPSQNIDTITSICYTSGTTGLPKGVIMTNKNFIAAIYASVIGPLKMPYLNLGTNDSHISYLPLAHIYERVLILICIYMGVRIGYYSGNVQTLIEDIQELKPTIFISVPRLFNRIYERIYNSLKNKSQLIQSLFNKGVDQKLKKINSNGANSHFFWDKLLFNKAKKILGGNIRVMLNGSAPISSDVLKKLRSIFSVPIIEGYGMTETLGPTFSSHTLDSEAGHIGGPIPCVEFKIVSITEMNYFINDNPPKGELYIRGNSISNLGYFKLKEATNELIDKDGWIRTGDIVELRKNGSVSIIDRKKNIFKLSQGEYIASEKIEAYYRQSLYISQIFIFGYSFESFLVCIIVPSTDTIEIWKKNKKITKSDEEVIALPEFKKDVINDLTSIGSKNGLKGFEQIKDIYFTLEPFTVENNILTPTGKIKRYDAFKMYKEQIDEMYQKKNIS